MQLSTGPCATAAARHGFASSEGLLPEPDEEGARASPMAVLPIHVHVHLAHGFDAEAWRRRWEDGTLLGLNEPTPYGYGWAESRVRRLTYSRDGAEGRLARLARLGTRAVLGFDVLHAWRNRRAIAASDVVWTHTESQFLAVALLGKLGSAARPALIGQSVWLFDGWERMGPLRRRFFRWLARDVDVLTVHSPANLAIARDLFAGQRSELVLFGISTDEVSPPRLRASAGTPFRVLALGNDRHRDWRTAIEAVGALDGVELTIVSATADPRLAEGVTNARIEPVRSNDALRALFAAADVVLVPLKPNRHASGITVLQEAAVKGLPAIATDTGGLQAYFGPDEVRYVPVGDARALAEALEELRDDAPERLAQASRAQKRMGPHGLSSQSFVERHLEISRTLAGREALAA